MTPSEDPYGPGSVGEIVGDANASSAVTTAVYNLSGVKVADSTDGLQPGIYIVRKGSRTKKIAVK